MSLNVKHAITLGLRWLLGVVLIWAALGKLANAQDFLANVYDYRIPLPGSFLRHVAVTLPWIELLCGLALLTGFWQESALGLVFMMMLIFLAATGQAWIRGLDIDCGCFGTALEKNSFLGSVEFAFFRNLALLGITWYLWARSMCDRRS